VIAFETEIAKGHWTPEQLRVPDQAFKAMDAAAFQALVPNIDIKAFAANSGVSSLSNMVAYGDTPSRPAPSWSTRSRLTCGRNISPSTSPPTTPPS
jgi:hypothetical protein